MRLFRPILILALTGCSAPNTPDVFTLDMIAVPARADAAGPRLSGSGPGPLILSWMEPDEAGTTLWYSTLGDAGWQPPQQVVAGKNMPD